MSTTSTSPANVSWQITDYPNRYYMMPDTTHLVNGNPTIVWIDVMAYTNKPDWLPPASALTALTEAEWNSRDTMHNVIVDGQTTSVGSSALPFAIQATFALNSGKKYVNDEYLVYGETVPDAWTTYLKALRAISDGTDTTSTTLPTSPLDAAPVVLTPAQKTAAALEALGEYLMEQQAKGFFFTPTGTEVAILFSTSSRAQSQYVGANSLARDNPDTPQNFITNSGAPIVLTAADVIKLTNGVASYINATNATYAALVEKVSADYTTDITVGWPDNKLP